VTKTALPYTEGSSAWFHFHRGSLGLCIARFPSDAKVCVRVPAELKEPDQRGAQTSVSKGLGRRAAETVAL